MKLTCCVLCFVSFKRHLCIHTLAQEYLVIIYRPSISTTCDGFVLVSFLELGTCLRLSVAGEVSFQGPSKLHLSLLGQAFVNELFLVVDACVSVYYILLRLA